MNSPIDFSKEVTPDTVCMNKSAVDDLISVFENEITEKCWHPSAQLVVLRHGKVVLDRATGIGRSGKPIDRDTAFYCFSISKPFTAMCIHKLAEEGRINLDEKVAVYWPEWGCKGKESATIRHVLLHQAGIPMPHQTEQVLYWTNWTKLMQVIAGYEAEYEPGTKMAYHQLNFGFILGEVVRRVTGTMIDEYFQKEFVEPLGLQHTKLRPDRAMMKSMPPLISKCSQMNLNSFVFGIPFNRSALMPAASLTSNARGLAVFFQMLVNGGKYGDRQYVKKETIENAIKLGFEGTDEIFKSHQQIGMGFFLGESLINAIPPLEKPLKVYGKEGSKTTFGHLGLGTSMVWADSKAGVVVAFTCNGMWHDGVAGLRWNEISDGVWNALK